MFYPCLFNLEFNGKRGMSRIPYIEEKSLICFFKEIVIKSRKLNE